MNSKIYSGNSLEVLPKLAEKSAQCCITSPPYWGLRGYEHENQIGSEESPIEYVQNLVAIFRQVRRVLTDDGTLWLNVGDGYARNGGTGVHGPNAVVGNTRKLIQRRNCRVPEGWGRTFESCQARQNKPSKYKALQGVIAQPCNARSSSVTRLKLIQYAGNTG